MHISPPPWRSIELFTLITIAVCRWKINIWIFEREKIVYLVNAAWLVVNIRVCSSCLVRVEAGKPCWVKRGCMAPHLPVALRTLTGPNEVVRCSGGWGVISICIIMDLMQARVGTGSHTSRTSYILSYWCVNLWICVSNKFYNTEGPKIGMSAETAVGVCRGRIYAKNFQVFGFHLLFT
jgi:hypothetical protein